LLTSIIFSLLFFRFTCYLYRLVLVGLGLAMFILPPEDGSSKRLGRKQVNVSKR